VTAFESRKSIYLAMTTQTWIKVVWIIGGAPALFYVVVRTYYRHAVARGIRAPYQSQPGRAIWFLAFAVSIISGLAALLLLPIEGTFARMGACGVYVLLVSAVNFMSALLLSVQSGDSK